MSATITPTRPVRAFDPDPEDRISQEFSETGVRLSELIGLSGTEIGERTAHLNYKSLRILFAQAVLRLGMEREARSGGRRNGGRRS